MSVATKNPFAVLDGRSLSFIFLHFSQLPDDVPVETKTEEPPTQTPVAQALARNTQKQRGGGPAARGGKYYPRGGKTQAPKETTAEDPVAENQRKCPRVPTLSILS
jgi:plasminogen activator inhibitor 1 RNA-binding protein